MLFTVNPSRTACGLPLLDQRLERALVDVVLELGRLDPHVDDLVHPLAGDVEAGRLGGDHGHGHRPAEPTRRRDQLVGHVPHPALEVLGDDEDTHASRSRRSSAIRCAICRRGLPSSSSAPAPRGGANIRRTR